MPTRVSIPVPMMGASVVSSGTAWRCILDPMSALLASSCSRKGKSAAAEAHHNCFGDTSMNEIPPGRGLTRYTLPPYLGGDQIAGSLTLLIHRSVGLGVSYCSSS
jgi:hypothetical protein